MNSNENTVVNKANEMLSESLYQNHVTISAIAKALHMKPSIVKEILDKNGFPIHKYGIEKEFDYITKKDVV